MLRRVSSFTSCVAATAMREYRQIPHMHYEIEEMAESQKGNRWSITHKASLSQPLTRAEGMADKMNQRERRRTGIAPEKSIARRLSSFYQKDGHVHYPLPEQRTKILNFTVVNFDGHPMHFRMPPQPEITLNNLIDGTGMCYGYPHWWSRCINPDCLDKNHGDGCMVNVDIDTLDKMAPPNRAEFQSLQMWRSYDRADITYTTRFSFQIRVSEEIDGAVFALKQFNSGVLRSNATGWSPTDDYATIGCLRSKRIEPWAPIIEEPTVRDFPLSFDMLWTQSYQDLLAVKDVKYKHLDGYSSRPQKWCGYV